MKFLRLLFSKWVVSALLFIIQIAIIVLVIALFNSYYGVFQIITSLIGVIVYFFIINKRENVDYKVPWLVLIAIFPLFGTVFYLLFANRKMRKKESALMKRVVDEVGPYLNYEYDPATLGDQNDSVSYLINSSFMPPCFNNDVKYYPVGELMWEDMLEELKKAKKFILMEYFIIDPGKMWDSIHEILVAKAKEGVKVHLLYDDVGTVTMLPSSYYKKLREEGIDAHKFNPFRPVLSSIYNNRDHRKIMVIDGEVGFTGGINLGDEYINQNDRLGHWKDTGMRLKGSAVNSLTALFFLNFSVAKNSFDNYGEYLLKEPIKYEEEGCIVPFGCGPKPIYQEQVGENNFINLISHAKRYVYITTPYLIIDYALTNALRVAALRGVDVRIITPHIPDKKVVFSMTRTSYKFLQEAGVKIYEYTPGFIHAKMLIADDEVAFVGTINLDYRSLTHHFECGALIYKNHIINDIKEDFDKTIEASEEKTLENFKLGWGWRLLNAILTPFKAMF